jgi:hypothetical protein
MAEKFDPAAYTAAYNKKNYARIEMKVPKELKENWEYKAEAAGMSLTAWIRNAANDAHVIPSPGADQEALLMAWIDAANGYYNNVVAYDDGFYDHARDLKLVFNRDHSKFYRSLLHFCADNGILVISTNPATFSTVVRIETK